MGWIKEVFGPGRLLAVGARSGVKSLLTDAPQRPAREADVKRGGQPRALDAPELSAMSGPSFNRAPTQVSGARNR